MWQRQSTESVLMCRFCVYKYQSTPSPSAIRFRIERLRVSEKRERHNINKKLQSKNKNKRQINQTKYTKRNKSKVSSKHNHVFNVNVIIMIPKKKKKQNIKCRNREGRKNASWLAHTHKIRTKQNKTCIFNSAPWFIYRRRNSIHIFCETNTFIWRILCEYDSHLNSNITSETRWHTHTATYQRYQHHFVENSKAKTQQPKLFFILLPRDRKTIIQKETAAKYIYVCSTQNGSRNKDDVSWIAFVGTIYNLILWLVTFLI